MKLCKRKKQGGNKTTEMNKEARVIIRAERKKLLWDWVLYGEGKGEQPSHWGFLLP